MNQLGILLGFSEMLLAETAVDDRRRGDFEEIHKAAMAALDLLARLFPDHADPERAQHDGVWRVDRIKGIL